MSIMVQKYGGNLLKDARHRERAIFHIQRALNEGHKVVAVVSALGRHGDCYATDSLIEQGIHLTARERDRLVAQGEVLAALILSNDLQGHGIKAYALNSQEIGIYTNANFGQATILSTDPFSIQALLKDYDVLVIPGFQGVTQFGEVTTLGRGGSDLTAVVLANALGLWDVEIYKDTQGIRSADPALVKQTKLRPRLSFFQMNILSEHGARVIQAQASEEAWKRGLMIRVLPFEGPLDEQTLISEQPSPDKVIAITSKGAQISIIGTFDDASLKTLQSLIPNRDINRFEGGLSWQESEPIPTIIQRLHQHYFE